MAPLREDSLGKARCSLVQIVGNAPLAFHLMAKPVGGPCNLNCKYCFYLPKTGGRIFRVFLKLRSQSSESRHISILQVDIASIESMAT